MVQRFLRAFDKGMRDYRAAFIGADEKPKRGPTAPEILGIIAKYIGQPVGQIEIAIPYVDDRLDLRDLRHQIAWYKSQNMLKNDIDLATIVDKRYVVALP
jgi:hypothetical protein